MIALFRLAACAAALCFAPAASADITAGSSGTPGAGIGAQMAALVGSERAALASAPREHLTRIAYPDPAAPLPGQRAVAGTAAGQLLDYSPAMLSALPPAEGGAQWECLTKALYFEARGESVAGQFAVGEVILNRVDSRSYPATVCGVVHQGASGGGGCQFSFMCDGRAERVGEPSAWNRAGKIARLLLDGAPRGLTGGATFFHNTAVRPGWAGAFTRTARIGAHIFYRSG